jgi:hypothetical protein
MTTNGNNGTNGLSKKREQTAQRIIKALGECNGLLTLVGKKAGVSYTTVKRYALELPTVRQAVDDAKEYMLDYAEGKLFQKIRDGDTAAIFFYLKTQGKSRGYVERSEHTGSDGRPIRLKVVYDDSDNA